jgi:hypothetical protein
VRTGEETVIALDDQTPIVSEALAIESERVIAAVADARLAHSDGKTDQTYTRAEAEGESVNGFFIPPEGDHARRATAVKRGAASKSAAASGGFQQMCFYWS